MSKVTFLQARAVALAMSLIIPFTVGQPFSAVAQQAAPATNTTADDDDTPAPLTEDELQVLVARIALYPDELVAVVTSASLYPLQIVEAARFLEEQKKNSSLKPKTSWDGSVISLLNYPDIVKMMSEDLDWTQQLGSALAYQQKDVLIAIQELREKAVADGVIKTDDKMKVETKNDNIVISSASTEMVYVPKYEPQMLYDPAYEPVPVSYYPDPYPYYYYPTAAFFAGAVTGAIWAAAVDWDDWGVWGGRWNGGDVDIDCNNCFNNRNFNGKVNLNDVDWKNVDRSKIKFDKNQFANLDRDKFKNDFRANKDNNIANRAKDIRTDRPAAGAGGNRPTKVSVDDVRKSKIDAAAKRDRAGQPGAGNRTPGANAGNRGGGGQQQARPKAGNANVANKARNTNANRPAGKPKPGGKIDRGGGKNPSALGRVQSGKVTHMQSNRGRQSMGGGHGGGGRQMHRPPPRHGGGGGGGRGGGGRGGGRR